jgi:hypothetical protein
LVIENNTNFWIEANRILIENKDINFVSKFLEKIHFRFNYVVPYHVSNKKVCVAIMEEYLKSQFEAKKSMFNYENVKID